MLKTLALAMIVFCFSSCAGQRISEKEVPEVLFDMHYGYPGAVEITVERVQVYKNANVRLYLNDRVVKVKLNIQQLNDIEKAIMDDAAIERLQQESKKGLYEVDHVHFYLSMNGQLQYYYVYFENMPPIIRKYMQRLEIIFSNLFPNMYVPMTMLKDG